MASCFCGKCKTGIMKRIKLIMLALGMFAFFVAGAQSQANQKQGTQPATTKAAPPAGAGNAVEQNSADSVGGKTANTTSQGTQATDANTGNSGAASSTPAVSQTTESMSGSPAILAADEGRKRDGTNSIQRATMNMAGSPVSNINVPKENVNPTTEIKQGTRAAENKNSSAQKKDERANAAASGRGTAQAKKLYNNTRNQNHDASDQSNASKKKAPSGEKSKGKKAGRKG
jgi:hypothetical protein